MIRFTRHAREKFVILRRHGIVISEPAVIRAIADPEVIDNSRESLKIAQRTFDKMRVLRVVYKEIGGDDKLVITFYPGRKKQYGKP